MRYIRKSFSILLIILILSVINYAGCSKAQNDNAKNVSDGKFTITFLDVGEGDCVIAKLPDGKILMVDCGEKTSFNTQSIVSVLQDYGSSVIDYLVLTHPDNDHIGNARYVINNYKVKNVYIPKIMDTSSYTEFDHVLSLLKQKSINTINPTTYLSISNQDYLIAFLSPLATDGKSSDYYSEFNGYSQPSNMQINDLSPIIYIQCMGMRVLLTSDASQTQENLLLQNYFSGFYNAVFGNGKINLVGVDICQLGGHGDNSSSSLEFLTLLSPKNAVISCGTGNSFSHPSTAVIERLVTASPNVKLWRTDVYSNICIKATKNASYTIN